jgi:hypothetical protein
VARLSGPGQRPTARRLPFSGPDPGLASGVGLDATVVVDLAPALEPGFVPVPQTAKDTARASGTPIVAILRSCLMDSYPDPTWALFSLLPTPGEVNFQSAYCFAHVTGESWTVVGFGSSMVGALRGPRGTRSCPPRSWPSSTCSTVELLRVERRRRASDRAAGEPALVVSARLVAELDAVT